MDKEKANTPLYVRFPRELWDWLQAQAKHDACTAQAVVKRLVNEAKRQATTERTA